MSIRKSVLFVLMTLALAACGGGSGGGSGGDEPDIDLIDPLAPKRFLLPAIAQADGAFESVHFSGAGICSDCHDADAMVVPTDSGTPKNVSIGTAWRTSIMANSTRDPYWHAVVESELDAFPMLEDEINETCIRCHAPMANELARKEGLELRLFDKTTEDGQVLTTGVYDFEREYAAEPDEQGNPVPIATNESRLFDHALDGVSCTACHQIDPGNLGDESSFTGGFEIVDARNLVEKPAYGQYAEPDANYMLAQSGYLAQQAAHMSSSETCATCHNLNVEPVDTEGNAVPGADHFTEQAVYSEWLLSDYRAGGQLEATCQDCHMPKLDRPVVLASGSSNVKRDNFAEHTFLGPNTVMQTMFRDFSEELGIPQDITEADWNESIARNRAFLSGAATVEIAGLARTALPLQEAEPAEQGENGEQSEAASELQEEVSFDVTTVNQTGHKLPSGYQSRRAYLHVIVTGENGIVWESGRIDPDGRIAGNAEDANPKDYERHYDLITEASQVQIYQPVVANSDNERTASNLNGSHYLKDNRLLPKGYDKHAVAADPNVADNFGTFGAAMDDDDFNSGSDTVTYKVRVPAGGSYRIRVELRYQPLAFGHLQRIFSKSDRLDRVDMFRTIYDATELRDEVIATDTGDVPGN